ncbi:PQQ-binding-like beta-propeller repeat protein [Streptomyces xanthophaeus]|uniref:Pyrrolo-quinoline quinone repeat domain-containing protein n=1 Tax=Streptomyces xanthophaeus TaxID=67385 RepID=A0A919H241_9ACTN|nr:PQQ-binding-like beta-propeller repeat protein [Streptomyces xanthophaeus]GHI88410.1 hypothetical protein Sxan_57740 [Streptomyces xanthophaeus]
MTAPPFVRRALGDGPFAGVGRPRVAVVDEPSQAVAVGGDVGPLFRSGHATADSGWTGHRIGIYERDGLHCRHLVRSSYPVHSLAFHPSLPLLAIGTGRYDGGYSYEGELLLLHLATGTAVSALQYGREVLSVDWQGATELRLLLAPYDDRQDPLSREQAHEAVVERADWAAVGPATLRDEELDAPVQLTIRQDHSHRARCLLTALAASAGRPWSPRGQVWAVEGLEDGRVLAALDGVLAESWLPSGERQWVVEDQEGGRQLVPASDGASVWTNAERRPRRKERWGTSSPRIERIALDDGQLLETLSHEASCVLVAGDRRTVLWQPNDRRRKRPERLMLFDLDGPAVDGPEAEELVVFDHPRPVRPAHRPYVLISADPDDSTHDKRVTVLSADETPRRLLPHTWVPQEHHFGGPAAEIGESLVYAATVPHGHGHGHGPLTGEAYVVRRSLKGSVLWQHRSDHPATALATDGESVYVACNSGTLTALDAHDGSVRWHTALEVDGEPATALCLAPAPGGRLLIGTVEGRILLQEGLRGSHA